MALFNPLLSGNPKRGTQANSADPDQMSHNAVSDQGLQCLLTAIFAKTQINLKKITPNTPKVANGLFQYIRVENSTRLQWVNIILIAVSSPWARPSQLYPSLAYKKDQD